LEAKNLTSWFLPEGHAMAGRLVREFPTAAGVLGRRARRARLSEPKPEATMRRWSRWTVGSAILASAVCSTLTAQAAPAVGGSKSDVCSLATDEEFQKAHGINPVIGLIPSTPEGTDMVWGPHCDYSDGSIDLFTEKSPSSELERVLTLTKGGKQRVPVQGLGQRAFFTTIYPDDQYRRRGFLAVLLGPKIVTISMDPNGDEPLEATRPKLEGLAKLVLPRVK
jgi:hypothetical protein